METPIYPGFLENPEEYEASELFWVALWNQVDALGRERYGWSYPWVGTGSPLIKDGNPIFSAHSPRLRRGVRVIQSEPLDQELDIQVWLSTFGGTKFDPDSIHELVIACVLSDEAARLALSLMTPWVQGSSLSFEYVNGVLVPPPPRRRPEFVFEFEEAA
jgi:hypothetical protein